MKYNLFNNLTNKPKKILGFMLGGIILTGALSLSVNAIMSNLGNAKSQRLMISRQGSPISYVTTTGNLIFSTFAKYSENGDLGLCMEHIKPAPLRQMYTKGDMLRDKGMKHIALADLEYGRYEITEIKTLENYVLNENPIYFDIKEDGKTVEITIENKPKEGYLEVVKLDAEYEIPLEGVEFTIYDLNDVEIEKIVTDKDGKATSNKLIYGDYKVVETDTLDNYILNPEQIEFIIRDEGEVVNKVFKNDTKKGNLSFTKVDKKSREIIPGAKIQITGEDKSNSHIKIEFESLEQASLFNLPIGEYKVKELEAPKNYIKSFASKDLEIIEGQTTEVSIENKKKPNLKPVNECIPGGVGSIDSNGSGNSINDNCNIIDKPTTSDNILSNIVVLAITSISIVVLNSKLTNNLIYRGRKK